MIQLVSNQTFIHYTTPTHQRLKLCSDNKRARIPAVTEILDFFLFKNKIWIQKMIQNFSLISIPSQDCIKTGEARQAWDGEFSSSQGEELADLLEEYNSGFAKGVRTARGHTLDTGIRSNEGVHPQYNVEQSLIHTHS
eukprot:g49541.t1